MNNQDFILRGEHLLKSPCEDKKKVLHPRTCSDQVLMEHDATSETSLFSWITTPGTPLAPDNEVCTSLIEWLRTYYPLDMEGALPLMSETKKGGAKLGNYLTVNTTTEKLSVDLESLEEAIWDDLPIATYSKLGAIIVDQNNFELSEAGKLSLKVATSTTFGGAKLGTSLGITDMIAIPNNANFKAFPIGKTVDGKIGALIPNAYLLSGTNWYLDYYRDTIAPEALGYCHVTSPTDSSGNANGINISSPVNYVLLGNTSEYGQMTQPTFALVAGSGIEFEFNLNQGANSFIPTLNFQRNVAEVKIKTSFPAASPTVIGGVKLASDTPIYDSLDQWQNAPDSDYDVYPIQLHTSGAMGFKLPRLTQASSSVMGGIKLGYTESGNNYAVKLDENGKAYVTVPSTSGGSTVEVSLPASVPTIGTTDTLLATITVDDTSYQIKAKRPAGYVLPVAEDGVLGGIALGYDNTSDTKKLPVEVDEDGEAFVDTAGLYTAGHDVSITNNAISIKEITETSGTLSTASITAEDQKHASYTVSGSGNLNIQIPSTNRLESTVILHRTSGEGLKIQFTDTSSQYVNMTQIVFLQDTASTSNRSVMSIARSSSDYNTQATWTDVVINIHKHIVYIYETYATT